MFGIQPLRPPLAGVSEMCLGRACAWPRNAGAEGGQACLLGDGDPGEVVPGLEGPPSLQSQVRPTK